MNCTTSWSKPESIPTACCSLQRRKSWGSSTSGFIRRTLLATSTTRCGIGGEGELAIGEGGGTRRVTSVLLAILFLLAEASYAQSTWDQLPGFAKDIGVGGDGSVWIIGTNPGGTEHDFGIHKWTGSNWQGIEGGAVRIDVDQSGNPWIVNSNGEIFRRVNDRWEHLPGFAKDIGVGGDGSVWIIGTNPRGTEHDFGIHKWTGSNWQGIEGGGSQDRCGSKRKSLDC